MKPLVSICIPTYRQVFLLKENLESICAQTYTHIEVLVSDDSPDDAVSGLAAQYAHRLPLQYFHNRPALGSPANWNAVLKKAQGEYVLLLHHDDQFATPHSLAAFVEAMQAKEAPDFVFGRNNSLAERTKGKPLPAAFFNRYYRHPPLLITGNLLGVPSNVFLRRTALMPYDERLKWIVDIEFYTRLFLAGKKFAYIDSVLIRTGVHEGQVTNECIDDRTVVLFENLTYAAMYLKRVDNLAVFDFYWRLLRNNGVRSTADFASVGLEVSAVPRFIRRMVWVQQKCHPKLLRNGVFSKLLMAATFLREKLA